MMGKIQQGQGQGDREHQGREYKDRRDQGWGHHDRSRARGLLLGSSAMLIGLLSGTQTVAQGACLPGALVCVDETGQVIGREVPAGADPAGPVGGLGATGFTISIDGQPLAGDPRVTDLVRRTDLVLAEADVQVSFDGLGAERRLDMEIGGPQRNLAPGEAVVLQSATNYPAFLARAEFRVVDMAAPGGPRVVAVVPVAVNGQAQFVLPQDDGQHLVVTHRVYDAVGRYDETLPLSLASAGGRGLADGVEDGSDSTGYRAIPVNGGAVTVTGQGANPGGDVLVMGESVRTDPSGGFVLQRILPTGTHGVAVQIPGAGGVALQRDVTIPASETFATGVVDLTFGYRQDADGNRSNYDVGRLAFYVDGRTASGLTYRFSADTTEMSLDELFSRLDGKDPRELLLRVDPRDLYPTYGDDSTIEDRTPSSGLVYGRIGQDNNYVLWGDFNAGLNGNLYALSERSLYGLQTYGETSQVTATGQPRASLMAYGAQPDQIAQRDVLRGTGGSVYFLARQDIARATETLSIQLRDPATGRILSTQPLEYGRDYQINYIQGVVTLNRPLSSYAGTGSMPGAGSADAYLIAQYEYTPVAGNLDGYALGARGEVWVTDDLRLGVSAVQDDTGPENYRLAAADVVWHHSEGTWIRLEAAQSEGRGIDGAISSDGGLIFDSSDPATGQGEAQRVEIRADLADFGAPGTGAVGAYYERRTEGFSALDVDVTSRTGTEEFWGLSFDNAPRDGLRYVLRYDSYENAVGNHDRSALAAITMRMGEATELTLGVEHEDLRDQSRSEQGSRTDLQARLDYRISEDRRVWLFGQTTLGRAGLESDDRLGLGGALSYDNGWEFEAEVSDGRAGFGARALVAHDNGRGGTRYFGWELDPGREISGVELRGRDSGHFIAGGRQPISDTTTIIAEGGFDLFGRYRSLTNSYGLEYVPAQGLSLRAAYQHGSITEDATTDFDRQALTLGMVWEETDLRAAARLEYRLDDGLRSGNEVRSESTLLAGDLEYRLDGERRFVASAELVRSESDESALLNGDYADVILGYAYRPVVDDRFNLLMRYRYLYDMVGQRIDDVDRNGPRQESHVLSVDASYAIDDHWTLAAKAGYRMSRVSPEEGAPFADNDALLVTANARWHVVHNWDLMVEGRVLETIQGDTTDFGLLLGAYRHFGDHLMLGAGYNFGRFSDDLTDMVHDDRGAFLNFVVQF